MTKSDFNADAVINSLAELADEQFVSVGKDWLGLAELIRGREPRPSAGGVGCLIDDRYFDIGEEEWWLGEVGGDILLPAYAVTYSDVGSEHRKASRSIVLKQSAVE